MVHEAHPRNATESTLTREKCIKSTFLLVARTIAVRRGTGMPKARQRRGVRREQDSRHESAARVFSRARGDSRRSSPTIEAWTPHGTVSETVGRDEPRLVILPPIHNDG